MYDYLTAISLVSVVCRLPLSIIELHARVWMQQRLLQVASTLQWQPRGFADLKIALDVSLSKTLFFW
jgi:hypothetical protein